MNKIFNFLLEVEFLVIDLIDLILRDLDKGAMIKSTFIAQRES